MIFGRLAQILLMTLALEYRTMSYIRSNFASGPEAERPAHKRNKKMWATFKSLCGDAVRQKI
jgi:hypothetical protein